MTAACSPVLAIDSSSDVCSVALRLNNGKILFRKSDEPRTHAQILLPFIESLLLEADLSLPQLDGIALCHGPGSFTGIRIAMSMAQGLAYGAGLPVQCISSLDALAYEGARHLSDHLGTPACETVLLPAIDARMGEVSWAAFECSGGSEIQIISEPRMSSYADFLTAIQTLSSNRSASIAPIGNAWTIETVAAYLSAQSWMAAIAISPSAYGVLLALSGALPANMTAADLEPLYLRNEIAWKKRVRIRP